MQNRETHATQTREAPYSFMHAHSWYKMETYKNRTNLATIWLYRGLVSQNIELKVLQKQLHNRGKLSKIDWIQKVMGTP